MVPFDTSISGLLGPAPQDARVYVIDDHSEMRKSFYLLLGAVGITTWPFATPLDFLGQIDDLPPAPILLDVRMPDLDGVGVMRELNRRQSAWPVILMTAHADVAVVVQLMKLGVTECLEKPFELEVAMVALDRAYALLAKANAESASAVDTQRRFGALTPREIEVIGKLLKGVQNKIVASDLCLIVRTVDMHRAKALKKLRTRNIAETVALAHIGHWTPSSVSLT